MTSMLLAAADRYEAAADRYVVASNNHIIATKVADDDTSGSAEVIATMVN